MILMEIVQMVLPAACVDCDQFKHIYFILHTCDIRKVFFLFQGGFSKMYRLYCQIVNSFQFLKSCMF